MYYPKILLIAALVLLASAYTEENHVLILTDDDFPSIIQEFPLILIEFYAPWCGHCKKLAPIYDKVAEELHAAGSTVRVAKIDCDTHTKAKSEYQVQGFPTLIFFDNGQQVKYNGQRSQEFLFNWLSKKTRESVLAIESSQIEHFSQDGKVNIFFYGDISSTEGQSFVALSKTDDYNSYFSVAQSDNTFGTVQIFRPFGESVTTTLTGDDLKTWIKLYERPIVYTFNDRTIGQIFSERGTAVVLFESAQAGAVLGQAFADAAQEVRVVAGKNIIFTDIALNAEHYGGLAQYIKVDVTKSPIIIIDGGKRIKFVLIKNPEDITAKDISNWVESVQNGSEKEYKIDEQVTYEAVVEEEL